MNLRRTLRAAVFATTAALTATALPATAQDLGTDLPASSLETIFNGLEDTFEDLKNRGHKITPEVKECMGLNKEVSHQLPEVTSLLCRQGMHDYRV